MSLQFFFEDGKGNAIDEDGNKPVEMQIDEESYPLDNITNFESAYNWYQEDQRETEKRLKSIDVEEKEEPKVKRGRKPLLNEDHKKFLEEKLVRILRQQFMVNECALSMKKAYFYPAERNSPAKIQERYDWVVRWSATDLDYLIRRPYEASNKKRKLPGASQASNSKAVKTRGTVTGYYINFIASTLDVMDRHEEFKNFFLVMDNVPIHTHEDIGRYIVARGYGCVYLPPYSAELNPIEQFWSVVKSKLKRNRLLDHETLSSRIADACNSILPSDLQGFCRYSEKKWAVCLDKKPL
ncbi:hypothetical protein [Parasitella parasitica]|uniref:Tc1-like transposase DDE domain-containing protein n=1 Tax=Parasitella parasitica TaxID=35722 RepID=A0A0B7NED7_9FUNG|nr:hypothetical protein [Parasitella parasitica]